MQCLSYREEMPGTMAREKRALEPTAGDALPPETKRPRVPALASIITEALKVESLQKLCSLLEPALRRVVSEEVERVIEKLGPSLNGSPRTKRIQVPPGIRRNLHLQFKSSIALPLYTGSKVEGEQGIAVHVVLVNANTGHVITTGPESSAKLEVVVLEGDFNREEDEDWTAEDFENHMVREREGKGPLLTGDLQITLRNGVGTLGDFVFTDNSSWIRSRKFRLGLKPFHEFSHIREAKTEAFAVKDHRGELYKKHYPPSPQDEVWRLEKVGKDGSFHKRLNQEGILTVEDFLRYAVRDPHKLRNILGSGMSNKMWESLLEHARTCVLSGKLYIYYSDDSKVVGVAFNSIYELCGLVAGQQYYAVEGLSEDQKVFAEGLMKKALNNWSEVVEYEGSVLPSSKPNNEEISSQVSSLPFSMEQQFCSYDQNFSHPSSHNLAFNEVAPFDGAAALGGAYDIERMEGYPGIGDSDLALFEDSVLPSCLPEDNMQDLLRRAPIDYQDEYSYMWPSSNREISSGRQGGSPGKAVVGWLKIKAAMRWGIFVRKKAAERRAKLVELAH